MSLRTQPCRRLLMSLDRCKFAPARRLLSTARETNQTRLSYFLQTKGAYNEFLDKIRASEILENPGGHDAAVVLVSPDLAKQLDNQSFISELVKALSRSSDVGNFNLLCAVVDNVAPALGDASSVSGVSVLRGHLDSLMPQLWQDAEPRQKADADSVAALTFNLGRPSITVPLTRTTFHNSRPSTLLSYRYDVSQGEPKLDQQAEKPTQQVNVSFDQPPQSIANLGLWAPLSPVTRGRLVTESFGNIVRGVDVDGQSTPASTELEDAVNTMFSHRAASEPPPGPMGVWAMITPETSQSSSWLSAGEPDPTAILQGEAVTQKDIDSVSSYVEQNFQSGSRLYQVLSGGGGWGPKKGLLSLDPQQMHFSLSEEEEMERFMRTMDNSGFAPVRSRLQFFIPAIASAGLTTSSATGVVFGVSRNAEEVPMETEDSRKGYLVANHFGALSNRGVYVSGPAQQDSQARDDSKLSVPNSRIYVAEGEAKSGGFFGFLGAGGLADVGTATLM